MRLFCAVLRVFSAIADVGLAIVVAVMFVFGCLPLLFLRGASREVPPRPRMLYIGYTSLDEARAKGLLHRPEDARQIYNYGGMLSAVTVFVPFGKRKHVTRLCKDILFVECAEDLWRTFVITQKIIRVGKGCLEARRRASEHDVVMIGGPHVASIPGIFVRLTTSLRVVLFIEAFWEDILPMQKYMSLVERGLWYRWYSVLYRAFHAYVGGPSFKQDFYVGRGMSRDRIWPYIHPVNAAELNEAAGSAELPVSIRNLSGPIILSIGRLEKEKLSADCLAIAARLVAKSETFRLIIVGEGSERAALEFEIARLGLRDNVFLLGAQPQAVTYAIAQRADICFAPYMGTALVEVLLAGCAVVAYDNSAHRGIAGDGPVIFIPHGDTVKGAEALANLLNDPVVLEARRDACRRFAAAKWNEQSISASYVAPMIGKDRWIASSVQNN